MIQLSQQAIEAMLERGYDRWMVMYSGGKDSTAALVLCIEVLKKHNILPEALYCDTGVEIPTLHEFALSFLQLVGVRQLAKAKILRPAPEDSFWVQVIGKGYPPPHQGFRWCTHRLKIKPVESYLSALDPLERERTLVVTGVRFGESDARDTRLRLSCSRGGECGQGVWYEQSQRLRIGYFSPIVIWRECEVWDFLTLIAPSWGYPTRDLTSVYKGRETRFGCWTCSVVSQDRTMQKIVQGEERWKPLLEFRNWLVEFARTPDNRVRKPNGQLGRLTLKARATILVRLREVEQKIQQSILSEIGYNCILQLWGDPRYSDSYDGG
ncbi:MAG: phosphoadenosine phosphosulfate reductase family protein [Fimbriimonadales bacterium]|nr:phosphoadenosine phosphosulfate reductase family protein [Fimbriimonadales bacterium]